MKEKTLAEKIWGAKAWDGIVEVVDVKDVKQFIKEILEEFMRRFYGSKITTKDYEEYLEFIKQKAGKELTVL